MNLIFFEAVVNIPTSLSVSTAKVQLAFVRILYKRGTLVAGNAVPVYLEETDR